MTIFTVFRFLMVGLVITCLFPWTGYTAEMGVKGIQYGTPDSFAEFHGFINLEYIDFQKNGPGDEVGPPGTSTFDIHNFYFSSIAKVRQNVTVLGEVEYEHGGGEVYLDRAFIDWNLFGDYLSVRLGKFYSPFGLEIREYQAPNRKLVSRPQMTDALLFSEWTDVGVNVYGQTKPGPVGLTYDLALVNGPGVLTDFTTPPGATPSLITIGENAKQNRDNNSNKTVIARVSVPLNLGGNLVEIGGSYSGGRYSDTGAPEALDYSLTGGDLQVQAAGINLKAEYVTRKVDIPGNVTVTQYSYYVQASYRLNFKQEGLNYLEPVVRYDFLDTDKDLAHDDTTQIALGVGYSPYPHFVTRAEYQINHKKDDPTTPTIDESKKVNGFLLQAVVDF